MRLALRVSVRKPGLEEGGLGGAGVDDVSPSFIFPDGSRMPGFGEG